MLAKLLGIDHVGVAVRDLDEAAKTYGEILGFALGGGETLPDRGLDVRFVDIGGTRLELIAPTRDDSQVSSFLDKRGEGIHHVCFRVDDIDAAIAGMKKRGARLIDEMPQRGAGGHKVAFIHPKGAHGVLIELIEPSS